LAAHPADGEQNFDWQFQRLSDLAATAEKFFQIRREKEKMEQCN
jgi:hypothetical protein